MAENWYLITSQVLYFSMHALYGSTEVMN